MKRNTTEQQQCKVTNLNNYIPKQDAVQIYRPIDTKWLDLPFPDMHWKSLQELQPNIYEYNTHISYSEWVLSDVIV